MLNSIILEKVLFLDIETVPLTESFETLSQPWQDLWEKKSRQFRKEEQTASDVYQRAGIYAEFGKIICISFGAIHTKDRVRSLRLKSLKNQSEKVLLSEFASLLIKLNSKNDLFLCAHNGKEFDFPYLSRRMLINGITLPSILDVAGKKPWETPFIDTMELWKFGDYKSYTSLDLLAHTFNIPSPKSDIDGSKVAEVYYTQNDIERIALYCRNDVITIVQLLLKFKGEPIISEEKIEVVI